MPTLIHTASTGVVTNVVELDREAIMSYTLVISATDNGESPLSGNGILTITIQDENDNTPEFMPDSYDATLPENSIEGAFVVDIFASDSDSGNNSEVSYFIVGGDTENTFQIDEISGIVTVQNSTLLDFETTPTFFLQIEARDMGINSLSSQTLVGTFSIVHYPRIMVRCQLTWNISSYVAGGDSVGC